VRTRLVLWKITRGNGSLLVIKVFINMGLQENIKRIREMMGIDDENSTPQIYVDMGGVLFKKMGADEGGQGNDNSYIGSELWNGIVKYKPIILSARGTKNITDNEKIKTDQVNKYLSPTPKIIFVGSGSEKGNDGRANKNSILIDDSQENIDKWVEKGGIGILHTNSNDTIQQLETIISKLGGDKLV